jgi:predicted CXXCH cytochrome family protein
MPVYGVRLISLLIAFLVLGAIVRWFLIPDSFYRFGHYRADSVVEIASDTPKYRGPDYCRQCHAAREAEWSGGIHKVVKCEVCHGAAGDHPATGKLPIPADTRDLCTRCHEAMPARPAAQPQIVVREHAGEQRCITCHNPHSPRIGDGAAAAAAGAPSSAALVGKCTGCHGVDGGGVGTFPPLAGKTREYLAQQLRDYRSGARENPMMNTLSASLTDEEIAALAAHFAARSAANAQ